MAEATQVVEKKRKSGGSREAKAAAILDAADAILTEAGYEALSARAVAERAGVNKALVFYYWGSTAELFERVLERYYERHKNALAKAFAREGTLEARLHHVIDEYLDFMEAHGAYARVVQQQVSTGGPHVAIVQKHLGEVLRMTTSMLSELTDEEGPLSGRHFHLSLSAAVINYFTYAPMLGEEFWGVDPLSKDALAERRAHVHWIVDAWLERLRRR
ncbi:MAG: TetR family transcriptional regulator [Myxococcota bacterium]